MNTTPPDKCTAWKLLARRRSAPAARRPMRAKAPGVLLDLSHQRLDRVTLRLLARLARERGFAEWRKALLTGKPVNSTENRPAWHSALRAGEAAPDEVKAALRKMKDLVFALRNQQRITRIVNLGTGGSDLGPRLVADALGDDVLQVHFAANTDPHDLERALKGADPARTLFIVVSKTFTTAETMANAERAKRWGAKSFFAVTANVEAARRFGADEVLPMWDWVGGRFSVWSPAGFSAACSMGFHKFEEFLAGAREIDIHFAKEGLERNVPALMALAGIWNVNFRRAASHAVLPYSNALTLLPAYLQQLEMESNGKGVDRNGRAVRYATAPVVWGAEGTPSQHSFHQLLHEGTQSVPVDFIDLGLDTGLSANLQAQAEALSRNGRPSSTLTLQGLDARNLGRLIALYEHKVFTQGVIWNINSFDQPGVELGKRLAREILARRQ